MTDINGINIAIGTHVKYSFNEFRLPVFTGVVILKDDEYYIEHSNKVTVKIDDSIKYIETVTLKCT